MKEALEQINPNQTNGFDFNLAVKELMAGKKINGKDGVLAPLVKLLVEAALEAEVESHIANDALSGKANRRNGYNTKTIKSPNESSFELSTPRDRDGSFEPQIVKKYQTTISDEIEERILSMYALGMSYNDISGHIRPLLIPILRKRKQTSISQHLSEKYSRYNK